MRGSSFERGALVVLSVMLVMVFAASVYMYDTVAEETAGGILSVFAENAREFVCENDSVAAFLGISQVEEYIDYEGIDVYAEAEAYIERYNEIYENGK